MSGFDDVKMDLGRPIDNAAPQHLTHALSAEIIKKLCFQCAAERKRLDRLALFDLCRMLRGRRGGLFIF
jgi:hypothetical protein